MIWVVRLWVRLGAFAQRHRASAELSCNRPDAPRRWRDLRPSGRLLRLALAVLLHHLDRRHALEQPLDAAGCERLDAAYFELVREKVRPRAAMMQPIDV
jgi:hypothetical protein